MGEQAHNLHSRHCQSLRLQFSRSHLTPVLYTVPAITTNIFLQFRAPVPAPRPWLCAGIQNRINVYIWNVAICGCSTGNNTSPSCKKCYNGGELKKIFKLPTKRLEKNHLNVIRLLEVVSLNNAKLRNILQRIADKDNTAFDDLYKGYSKVIFGIALSLLKNEENCNDIVQLVMSKLFTMPKESFPTSHELTWLYTVTKNEALQFLRKEKLHIPLDDVLDMSSGIDDFSHVVDMDKYRDMIKSLDEKSQAIVTLKVIAGFSHKEIGKLLHTPIGTVQWKYNMAVNKLRITLANFVIFIASSLFGYAYIRIRESMYGGGELPIEIFKKIIFSNWIFATITGIACVTLTISICLTINHLSKRKNSKNKIKR